MHTIVLRLLRPNYDSKTGVTKNWLLIGIIIKGSARFKVRFMITIPRKIIEWEDKRDWKAKVGREKRFLIFTNSK